MNPKVVTVDEKSQVRVVDYVLPDLGDHDVRAATLVSGISHGTELHALEGGRARYPVRLGYSAVARVTEVGPQVTRCGPGDLIFAYAPHSNAFQTSEERCWVLDQDVAPERGQFLALLGVAYNGIMESRMTLGDSVAVLGLGSVGQLVCQLARRAGARRVIGVDPVEHRRRIALACGADAVADPVTQDPGAIIRAANGGEDADCAIETSGAVSGLNAAMKVVRDQATVVCLSLYRGSCVDLVLNQEFHFKRLKLRSAQFDSVPPELMGRWTHERRLRVAAEMLPALTLDGLITHRFRPARVQEAYRLLRESPKETLQMVFLWDGQEEGPA